MPEGQQPAKKGFTLFGKKKEEGGPSISDTLENINEVARRLRIIEGRHTDLDRKTQFIEKNMLNEKKRVIRELKANDSDILELKKEIAEIKSKLEMMAADLKNFASKEDVESLRKYIELWEPVNFATREEVEKIVQEAVEENR